MRKIKFRSWDGFNKKMSFWIMNDLCTWDGKTEKPSPLEGWMQFIGLTDKNGKEIYESDIVEDDENIEWEVRWEFNQWVFISQNTRRAFVPESVEVIGNIYERYREKNKIPKNMEQNWKKEFELFWKKTRNGTEVDYQELKDFIFRLMEKEKKICKEKLEHLENYYQKLVKMRDSEAEKRGTEKERAKIKTDLLKIADDGEIEELRREVENYFKVNPIFNKLK